MAPSHPTDSPTSAQSQAPKRLTTAQAILLSRMGFVKDKLKNGDEQRPMWWLEGEPGGVKANVARSLIRRDIIRLTGKWGGSPGILGFTVTAAGREALCEYEGRTLFPTSSDRGGLA